jgi:hypothetical protein
LPIDPEKNMSDASNPSHPQGMKIYAIPFPEHSMTIEERGLFEEGNG